MSLLSRMTTTLGLLWRADPRFDYGAICTLTCPVFSAPTSRTGLGDWHPSSLEQHASCRGSAWFALASAATNHVLRLPIALAFLLSDQPTLPCGN
jgi:hypothetical protein